jgi:hypothetical protein
MNALNLVAPPPKAPSLPDIANVACLNFSEPHFTHLLGGEGGIGIKSLHYFFSALSYYILALNFNLTYIFY